MKTSELKDIFKVAFGKWNIYEVIWPSWCDLVINVRKASGSKTKTNQGSFQLQLELSTHLFPCWYFETLAFSFPPPSTLLLFKPQLFVPAAVGLLIISESYYSCKTWLKCLHDCKPYLPYNRFHVISCGGQADTQHNGVRGRGENTGDDGIPHGEWQHRVNHKNNK